MATTVARLEALLTAHTRDFDRAMGRSESKLKSVGKTAGLVAGGAALGAVAYTLKSGVSEWMEQQKVMAQTQAALKSTGGTARVTAKDITHLSNSIMKKTGIDDEQIQSAENLLLTFRNIHNQTGKNNKMFTQATKATVDLSVAFHKGLNQSAVLVGKALNDPIKGLTALQRVGVQFDSAQRQQIKDLIEGRKAIDTITLGFDGLSAKQSEQAVKLSKLGFGWQEIADTLHLKYTPAQKKAFDFMEAGGHTLQAQKIIMAELKKETEGSAEAYGKTLPGMISIARESFRNWSAELITKMIPAIQTTVSWIRDHWPEISKTISVAWNGTIKPLLTALISLVVQVVKTIREHWGTIGPIVMNVVAIIRTAVSQITGILRLVTALLRGDWSEAWKQLKNIVSNAFNLIKEYLSLQIKIFRALGEAIIKGFAAGISAGWELVKKAVTGLFGKVIDWAKGALGISSPSAVFHSIGQHAIQGFINGVGSMGGLLKKAVVGIAKHAISTIGGFFTGGAGKADDAVGGLTSRVVQAVQFARLHGWQGQVTSGWRSYAEQSRLYQRYLHGGPLAAKPGTSSHEFGQAVDVSDPSGFQRAMNLMSASARLYNRLGAADPVHFSVSGYDKGGWLPKGLSLAMNNTGRPERVLGPGEGGNVTFNFPNYVGSKQELMGMLREAAAQFQRRNNRPAFG